MRAIRLTWLTATLCAAQLAHAADKVFDKKFPVSAGGTLTVDTDAGSIHVVGADVRELTVRATLSGAQSQLDDFEITARPDSRGVTVRGERYGDWWLDLSWFFGGGLRVRYEIQVPQKYHLDLRTAGGSIELQRLEGNIHGHTSGGRLRLDEVKGTIDLRSSGGGIQADRIDGNAQLRTSGGSITVSQARGALDVRTSGGSLRLHDIDAKLDARTSGGSIDVTLRGANRGVTLKTSGGSIRIDVPKDYKAAIDAHTGGGSVHSDLPLSSGDRDDDRNTLIGEFNGGGPPLSARTSGGSIRIRARE